MPIARPIGDAAPSASDSASGSIRVAGIDLLIFSPRTVHQPCAKMLFGSGSPAAIRNAGQYTVWKRRMSLPMTCTACGQ